MPLDPAGIVLSFWSIAAASWTACYVMHRQVRQSGLQRRELPREADYQNQENNAHQPPQMEAYKAAAITPPPCPLR
jgi:hypothetical protein